MNMERHVAGGGYRVDANQAPWVAGLVFGVFMLVGIGLLLFGIQAWKNAEASRSWPSVEGRVISSEVKTLHSRSRSSHGGSHTSITYGAEIVYQYSYQGQEYRSNKVGMMSASSSDYSLADRTVRRYALGTPVKVFVNSKDPSEGVLTPGAGWGEVLMVVIGLVFGLIGGLGVVGMFMKPSSVVSKDVNNGNGDRLSQI
jgi:hypothetical protein